MSEHARPWPRRRLLVAALLLALAAVVWLLSNSVAASPAPLLRLLAVSCAVAGAYIAVLTVIVRRFQLRTSTFNISALLFGFAFLYVPILVMIVFSFNSSRLITSWGGFSLRWYQRLFE